MRKQLVDSDQTPLYGAMDDEETTIFSRELKRDDPDDKMAVTKGVGEGDRNVQNGNAGSEQKLKYPKSVFFIISNEFCERFSYYGMRAVLSIYLKDALNYEENTATIIYHVFVMLCYFTPLFGGIMADAWLGKFRTIMYVSMLYAAGNIVLSFGSIEALAIPHRVLSLLGLLLIAVGTGGIKPCVSSFGGDQFILPQQERQLQRFFSVFYFSINAGSVISSFVTPKIREMHCLGSKEDCYPVAFGLPAALMIVAIVIFACGSPMYKKIKTKGNIALDISKCVSHAVVKKVNSKEKRSHWLDYADDKYSQSLISNTKILMKLIVLFSPTIVFWALFEQQGSKWTFQATRMNGDLGGFVVEPDQMQTLNAVLVLVFIPLFESALYPLLAKLRLVRTPLQKMIIGGFLAASAFVVSGLLEIKIEGDLPSLPGHGQSQLMIYNTFNCDAQLASDKINAHLPKLSYISLPDLEAKNITMNVTGNCFSAWNSQIYLPNGQIASYMLRSDVKNGTDLFPLSYSGVEEVKKDPTSNPKIKVLYSGDDDIVVVLKKADNINTFAITGGSHQGVQQKMVGIGDYTITINGQKHPNIAVSQGGVYMLMITKLGKELNTEMFVITSPNSVNILWQIPQYVVITAAEIMFSITGLEFSYSQSPVSLKSIISSLWLLTDALGNVIILIIESIDMSNKILEFFVYAIVMAVAMLIFMFLAIRYKPTTEEEKGHRDEQQLEEHTKI